MKPNDLSFSRGSFFHIYSYVHRSSDRMREKRDGDEGE